MNLTTNLKHKILVNATPTLAQKPILKQQMRLKLQKENRNEERKRKKKKLKNKARK